MEWEEIFESSTVLSSKMDSKAYLEGNRSYFRELYPGKKLLAITVDGESEIAAAYYPESNRNELQALDAIEKNHPEEAYHSIKSVVLEKLEE